MRVWVLGPSATIVTSDFSPSEMAIVVARRTSMHADEYQGFGRMPRGLFADDFWPRLSVAGLSAVSLDSASFPSISLRLSAK